MTDNPATLVVLAEPPAEKLAELFQLTTGVAGAGVREYLDLVQLAVARTIYRHCIQAGAVDGYRAPGAATLDLTPTERRVFDYIAERCREEHRGRFKLNFGGSQDHAILGLSTSYFHTVLNALILKGAISRIRQGLYALRAGAE